MMLKPVPIPPFNDPPQTLTATEGHRAARAALRSIGELFFSGQQGLPSGLRFRMSPLLAGPTGSGKTFLISDVARSLNAHYFRVCRSDWTPQGSARGRATLFRILDQVATHERLLLHIDELDKFQGDFGTSDWGASIMGDLWDLLEKSLPVEEYLRETQFPGRETPTKAKMNSWIQTGCWIVGSGTWQEVFRNSKTGSAIGFLTNGEGTGVTSETIAHSEMISPELLHRFNTDLIFLGYPNVEETARLLESSGINALAREVGQAIKPNSVVWEHGGIRALESIATRLAIARLERDRSLVSAASGGGSLSASPKRVANSRSPS